MLKKLTKYRFVGQIASLISATLNLFIHWATLVSILATLSAGITGWVFAWIDGNSRLGITLTFLLTFSLIYWGIHGFKKLKAHWQNRRTLDRIIAKNYRDCEVDINGKQFEQCYFENVRFVWDEKRKYQFIECDFKGNNHIEMDVLYPVLTLLETIQLLSPGSVQKNKV